MFESLRRDYLRVMTTDDEAVVDNSPGYLLRFFLRGWFEEA
jgi:hypothetical protein